MHRVLTVFANTSDAELITVGPLWPAKKERAHSQFMCWITSRKEMSTGRDIVVCVGHLSRFKAKEDVPVRTAFGDQLAALCVGGARLFGSDLNMSVCGTIP